MLIKTDEITSYTHTYELCNLKIDINNLDSLGNEYMIKIWLEKV